MGRVKSKKPTGRDPGGFVALPWSVLDCPAWAALSHPARSLLLELARQYVRDNNGRLLASRAYLAKRGWKSADVIDRAKRELLAAGFIFETVKGQRPSRASWYAVTWYVLDRHVGYDEGATAAFRRGAYRENAILCPSGGTERPLRGPSHGTGGMVTGPAGGPVSGVFGPSSVPSHGHHLDNHLHA